MKTMEPVVDMYEYTVGTEQVGFNVAMILMARRKGIRVDGVLA